MAGYSLIVADDILALLEESSRCQWILTHLVQYSRNLGVEMAGFDGMDLSGSCASNGSGNDRTCEVSLATLAGQQVFTASICLSADVADLKRSVQAKLGIPASHQRLLDVDGEISGQLWQNSDCAKPLGLSLIIDPDAPWRAMAAAVKSYCFASDAPRCGYLFYRLPIRDTEAANLPKSWHLVNVVPDNAKIKNRMLAASWCHQLKINVSQHLVGKASDAWNDLEDLEEWLSRTSNRTPDP